MGISNINGKSVYVITPTKVESSKDSTGNSWATMYSRNRQMIWDQIVAGNASDQELVLKQRKLINDRLMNLEDIIGSLRKGELDAARAVQMNNDDNITAIEKAKLDASEVATSSKVGTGSRGGSSGGGVVATDLSADEKKAASAIRTATDSINLDFTKEGDDALASRAAGQLVANINVQTSTGTERNVLNINGVKVEALRGAEEDLYNKAIRAGKSEDEAYAFVAKAIEALPADLRNLRDADADGEDTGSGGNGYTSASSYRKATSQAAIDAARASVGVAPKADTSDLESKVASLEAQLGSLSNTSNRQRFAQEVGGIWGFADRPGYTQNYQTPEGTADRVDQLVDTYRAAATKALAQSGIPLADMTEEEITQAAMTMLKKDMNLRRDDSGFRPVSSENYMREEDVTKEREGKESKANPVTNQASNDQPDDGPKPADRKTKPEPDPDIDLGGGVLPATPEDGPVSSLDKARRDKSKEALLAILEADKMSDDPTAVARFDDKGTVGKIAAMSTDPSKALTEVDRAYKGDPAALRRARNEYLARYLLEQKNLT